MAPKNLRVLLCFNNTIIISTNNFMYKRGLEKIYISVPN